MIYTVKFHMSLIHRACEISFVFEQVCASTVSDIPEANDADNCFRLHLDYIHRYFDFEAADAEGKNSWTEAVRSVGRKHNEHIATAYHKCVVWKFALPPMFWKYSSSVAATTYELQNMARTGDIVLFRSKGDAIATAQRSFTKGEYDHTGRSVIQIMSNNVNRFSTTCVDIYVTTENPYTGLILRFSDNRLGLLEATGDVGVAITYWDDFLMYEYGQIYSRLVVRQLEVGCTSMYILPVRSLTQDTHQFCTLN